MTRTSGTWKRREGDTGHTETFDRGRRVAHENRYDVASLPARRLTHGQWLLLAGRHWGVENNCHHFEEDCRAWIHTDPRGALVVALLPCLAEIC